MMTDRFAEGVKIILYVVAGLLPVFFLPAPFGADAGREIVLTVLTAAALIAWLVSALAGGEIRYPVSPLIWAAGALLVAWGVSAVASHSPMYSFLYADAAAEQMATLALGLVVMAVAAGALRRRAESGTLLLILISAGAAAGLLSLYTFLVGPIGFLSAQPYFNVIGTVNGLALFYAALLMMAAGLLLSPAAGGWNARVRWCLVAATGVFLLNLAIINFRTAWIAVLGTSVCLFGLLLVGRIHGSGTRGPGLTGTGAAHSTSDNIGSGAFGWRQWTALGMVLFSLIMIMAPRTLITSLAAPVEVSPSWSATFSIAGSVFTEGPLRVFFGSGPGTFGLDWARYKDPSINQTVFWGVRFTQGQSWIAGALPTAGIIGFSALLAFFGAMLFLFLRMMLRVASPEEDAPRAGAPDDALATGAFLGCVTLLIAAFLYPANASLALLLFLCAGTLMSLLARRLPEAVEMMETEQAITTTQEEGEGGEMFEVRLRTEIRTEDGDWRDDAGAEPPAGGSAPAASPPALRRRGFWDIRERRLAFETPWLVFASSLAIIFFVALGIAAIYGALGQARSLVIADRGVRAYNEGNTEDAIAHLERAVGYEPRNWRTVQTLTQLRIERVRALIGRAAGGADVRQEFQSAVSAAIQESQRLTQLHEREPMAWRIQGSLYEAVIPFIQGAERFAAAAYQRATELEPANPVAYVDWGRAGLVFTDRIAVLAQQASGKEREDAQKARAEQLQQIVGIFQRALQVKPDFAPAHFLLAQTAIRLGDINAAIVSVENAKLAAPSDIGVAFQLGLLYYQKGEVDRAELEFERAVQINENYSNARYFLGLIHDRKKDVPKALEQFERIAQLNPGNQEVLRIIANLKTGKPALDGIVPPAPPPQERKDVPIPETEERR